MNALTVMCCAEYGNYLKKRLSASTFLLGFATTVVNVYYLAINNISFLKSVFPSFWLFSILALAVGVPFAIFMAFFRFKRSEAFSAEVDIGV